jgi:hypothetical protein
LNLVGVVAGGLSLLPLAGIAAGAWYYNSYKTE